MHKLTDTELGALVRQELARTGIRRIEIYGEPGKERIDAIPIKRVYPRRTHVVSIDCPEWFNKS